jgi:uncharacterized protein (UPF0212 family)
MNILTEDAISAAVIKAGLCNCPQCRSNVETVFEAALAKLIEQGHAKRFAIQSDKEGEMLKMKFVYQIEEQPNENI